jgi:spermidine synthase
LSKDFEELDYRKTALGDVSLRRRRMLSLGGLEVFEIQLGDAFLMSSLFHEVEEALASLAFAELGDGAWDVVVGGLGLGYTAAAALEHASLRSLLVVEALDAVIDWHKRRLVPLGEKITGDERCRFIHADFFAAATSAAGFDPEAPARQFHAVLLDIDHSPTNLLDESNASFYQPDALRRFAEHLHPNGIFAMWSDDPPDEQFLRVLDEAFATSRAHIVSFWNPLLDSQSASTVYVCR